MGIDQFTKHMILGTLVMTIATVLLPVVGPAIQNDQDIEKLLMKPLSLIWYGFLIVSMSVSGIVVMVINLEKIYNEIAVIVLLIAQVSSKVASITVSKTFVIVSGSSLLIAWGVWALSSIVLVYTVCKQATVVQQSTYVPLMVSTTLIVNAVTGIIIWEDGLVMNSWRGYISVFLLYIISNSYMNSNNFPRLLGIENKKYGIKETLYILRERFCTNERELLFDEGSDEIPYDIYEQDRITLGAYATGYVSLSSHSLNSVEAWKDAFDLISDNDMAYASTRTI